ncbi:hypothetical protein Q3A66_11555 [Hymenobacter sp. BT770]|nr:hypothetical protein [Hymenobacter sp. BT770]MDO3415704.1 hypothetical protein [Hymenobacter sp. BT770]
MADDTAGRVHGQAAEVVERAGLAGLDGNARVRVGGAVKRLVAEQTCFFVLRAHGPGLGTSLGLPGGFAAQVMRGRRDKRRRGRRPARWVFVGKVRRPGLLRLLFAQAVERGVGFDGRRVHGLGIAGHQAPGHALGEDVVKQALEHGGREELAGAADGRVPGQFLVHLVAEKVEDVQAQGAVLDEPAVADQVFQPAHQHELEKDHRVERGLPGVAVQAPGLVVEKGPVHQLGQPPVQIMGRNPLGEPKADHLFIEVLLLALHPCSTNR